MTDRLWNVLRRASSPVGHERIEAEQEQHVEHEQRDDTDDEDDNHLLIG